MAIKNTMRTRANGSNGGSTEKKYLRTATPRSSGMSYTRTATPKKKKPY